jgi:hypothetical protein
MVESYERRLKEGFGAVLREASEFFMGQGDVYHSLQRLADRLDRERIPYALVGGLALARHGFVRMTQDVDILLTREGLEAFKARFMGRGYVPAFPGAEKTFRDTETGVRIEVITTGEYPGDGLPKPVSFPAPDQVGEVRDGIRVINLETLIELKLASGLTAPHRLRDLADVQDLIKMLQLPLDLAEQLDSSVRDKYVELWQASRSAES